MRPVLEIMFGDFLAALDGQPDQPGDEVLVPDRGRQSVPLVIRSVVGAGGRFGAIHSQMPVSWLTGITGLKIVAPSTPADAKGLLKAAIRDDNPVVFFEHKRLYSLKGPTVSGEPATSSAARRSCATATDVTLVSAMKGVHDCLAAAELLAEQGVSAEVIDLRTIRPVDVETIVALGREDEPARGRRGGPADRRLGGRGARARHRARRSAISTTPGGSRRRLADPLQPAARGRVPAGRGADRRRGVEPTLTTQLNRRIHG